MIGKQSLIVGEASVQMEKGLINIVIKWLGFNNREGLIELRAKSLASYKV